MRRVIDDTHLERLADMLTEIIFAIPADKVSEYDYGTYRSQSHLIKDFILKHTNNIKFGQSMNKTGIGNNGCYELIYTGDPLEEQIFGLIHLTNNMYGGTICWISDYDNNIEWKSRTIHGCNPKDERAVARLRYAE